MMLRLGAALVLSALAQTGAAETRLLDWADLDGWESDDH